MPFLPQTDAFLRKLERLQEVVIKVAIDSSVDPWLTPEVMSFVEELEITAPEGKIRLTRNSPQEKIWEWWLGCRERRVRAKGICCKCRQQGITTFIMAICFTDIYCRPHRRALFAAHDTPDSEKIFLISKNYYDFLSLNLGEDIRPKQYTTKRLIHLENPHNSIIETRTSNNKNLGSGGTLNMFHASEVGKWNRTREREAMDSVQGCLTRAGWDSLDFWESTACGEYGIFAEEFHAAESGLIDRKAFFFGYQDFRDHTGKRLYYIDIPDGYEVDCTPEERKVQVENNLSEGHFAFWLDKKNNSYGGSYDIAHQEFPSTAKLAFKHSGNPLLQVGAMEVIHGWLKEKQPLIRRGILRWTSDQYMVVAFEEDPHGWLEIVEEPLPGRDYVNALDVGEGVGRGGDYSTGMVALVPQDGERRRQVAKMRSNDVPAIKMGLRSFMLGCYYNFALSAGERNGLGIAALIPFERGNKEAVQTKDGYPNCYRHVVIDRATKQPTDKIGWNTQATYKDQAVAKLQQEVAEHSWELFSEETFLELRGMQTKSRQGSRRLELQATYPDPVTRRSHDDETMCMVILNDLIDNVIESGGYKPAEDGSW